MYESVASSGTGVPALDGAALTGFRKANSFQGGCLTSDQELRFHTCELGSGCKFLQARDVVCIIPIVGRTVDGLEVNEAGAAASINSNALLEIDLGNAEAASLLMQLCFRMLFRSEEREQALHLTRIAIASDNKTLRLHGAERLNDADEIGFDTLVDCLKDTAAYGKLDSIQQRPGQQATKTPARSILPKEIVGAELISGSQCS